MKKKHSNSYIGDTDSGLHGMNMQIDETLIVRVGGLRSSKRTRVSNLQPHALAIGRPAAVSLYADIQGVVLQAEPSSRPGPAQVQRGCELGSWAMGEECIPAEAYGETPPLQSVVGPDVVSQLLQLLAKLLDSFPPKCFGRAKACESVGQPRARGQQICKHTGLRTTPEA
jgi:hypothetical protein